MNKTMLILGLLVLATLIGIASTTQPVNPCEIEPVTRTIGDYQVHMCE